MPSALVANDKISFIVARPFSSRGKDYAIGDDFPQEDSDKIEVFVRARFVIPVVEELTDKPRHWHREIRPRDEVMARLRRDHTQLVMPAETPADESAEEQVELVDTSDEPFDPSEHTVIEVQDYLGEHPDDTERVLAAERADRGRKGILGDD